MSKITILIAFLFALMAMAIMSLAMVFSGYKNRKSGSSEHCGRQAPRAGDTMNGPVCFGNKGCQGKNFNS